MLLINLKHVKGTLVSDTVCVLGEGAFGTAFAALLAQRGLKVNLWCHSPQIANDIQANHINSKYFPDIKLSDNITATNNMHEAISGVEWIFEAIPIKYLRSVLELAKPHVKKEQIWITLSKGIEHGTLFFPTEIVDDVLEFKTKKAVISGPSFAKDLLNKQLTAVNISASDKQLAQDLSLALGSDYFKPYIIDDMKGIQVCGAIKNVISIFIGMAQGAGYGENTKGFLITLGINEIVKLTQFFGGKTETVYNLCGIGDLIISSFGQSGRNFLIGCELGAGKKLQDIVAKKELMPEGINTVQSIYELIQKNNLDLQICNKVYQVIFENIKFDLNF